MGAHLIDGEFQSDKYPTTPRGKVPLSVKDPTAQDLLWEYAQRRRVVDAEFSADLEAALLAAGYRHAPARCLRLVVPCTSDAARREMLQRQEDDRCPACGEIGCGGACCAGAGFPQKRNEKARPEVQCEISVCAECGSARCWEGELMCERSRTANVTTKQVAGYRCQFCGETSPLAKWKRGGDECPKCGRIYDAMLAQEEDDG